LELAGRKKGNDECGDPSPFDYAQGQDAGEDGDGKLFGLK
jgi:hypothetical protein